MASYVSQPLRVLHVAEACGGGVLEMVSALTDRLTYRGHKSAVIYGSRPETPENMEAHFSSSVDLIRLPWGPRTVASTSAGIVRLRGAASDWHPDVIHLHSAFAGAAGALVLRRVAPLIYSPHGYAFAVPRSRVAASAIIGAERLISRSVDVIGAVSQTEGSEARTIARARRVAVIPNGLPELDGMSAYGEPVEKQPLVVASGRPVPQRQPVEAAGILESVRDLADVTWIGGGYEDDEGMRALRAGGIPCTGWLTRSEALGRVNKAMVYLHWTAWDGLALSLLEAMARDVIVVAHDIPVSREVLGPEQVRKTPGEAVELIRRILRDESLRQRLLANQREARMRYTAEAMVDGWETLYKSLGGVIA